ncbi:hypothetical protein [Cryobacterium zongtaii]|uniref:hypothetical protein n=1 Tax=Cryobacterium zongtaii TaxID=1259217 RepID=UPI0010573951|nr:hypothetical protein [Cryobacterium zongtaii]
MHEMRITVQSARAPGSSIAVTEILLAGLGTWRAAPLFNPREAHAHHNDTRLITAQVPERVGSPSYVRRAHTVVQELLNDAGISRAEADIPVRSSSGIEPGAAPPGPENSPPGSEASRWAREVIRGAEAWAIPPEPGGASRGRGIVVGHPDTGYTLHPNLGVAALDLARDWDFIDDDDDALDPLVPTDESLWPLANPGHGTSTASVIVGRAARRPALWESHRRRPSSHCEPSRVWCSSSTAIWRAAWTTPGPGVLTSSRSVSVARVFSGCARQSSERWMPAR